MKIERLSGATILNHPDMGAPPTTCANSAVNVAKTAAITPRTKRAKVTDTWC